MAALVVAVTSPVTAFLFEASAGVEEAVAKRCKGARAQPRQIGTFEARRAVVCLINKKRRKHGLRNLKGKPSLHRAARRHSSTMRRKRCFSHRCSGEPSLERRLKRSGYLPCVCSWGVAENIAWGSRRRGSPRAVVKTWMRSSSHRANILNRMFEHIGAGVVWGSPKNPRARAGTYTTVFGYRD